jgi:hypothetical protein
MEQAKLDRSISGCQGECAGWSLALLPARVTARYGTDLNQSFRFSFAGRAANEPMRWRRFRTVSRIDFAISRLMKNAGRLYIKSWSAD